MPTIIFFGSFASIAIEWSPMPPKPGTHFARDGWSSRLFTIDHVSPRSSLLKSAAGSVPAQTTFGVFSCPGSMCQVFEKVRSVPSGKAGFFVVFHVLPMSRLTSMRDPPHVWFTAANIDPSRGSYAAWWISAGAHSGPSHAHEPRLASPRRMYMPLFVAIRRVTYYALSHL